MKIYNTPKILKLIKHEIHPFTYPASSDFTETIAHNLGFIPITMIYVLDINPTTKVVEARFPMPGHIGGWTFTFGSASVPNWLNYTVDENNIYIDFQASISGVDVDNFDLFYNPIYFEYLLFRATI